MIPLRDNIPSRTRPVVNYSLIGICALVFLAQLPDQAGSLIERFGMIPARVTHPGQMFAIPDRQMVPSSDGRQMREGMRTMSTAVRGWLTLLTCIFLHGGWMHFLGNMWFLHIFGDNVEDRFGHFGYLLFYLGCGIAASVSHLATDPNSVIPTIGASGSIAGVMGAYSLLYPRANVLTLIPIFFFIEILVLPAPLFLGIWFIIQLFQGTFAITVLETTGVAWWAHIGGFVVGLTVAWILKSVHHVRPPVPERLPNTDHVTHFRYRRR